MNRFRNLKATLAALCLLTAPLAGAEQAPAQLPRFDAGGLRVGDALTDAFAASHCPEPADARGHRHCRRQIGLGPNQLEMTYHFYGGKLISAGLHFRPIQFDDIVSAYTRKFGAAPDQRNMDLFRGRRGGKYTNITVSWKTDSGRFEINKYAGEGRHGEACLYSPQLEAARTAGSESADVLDQL